MIAPSAAVPVSIPLPASVSPVPVCCCKHGWRLQVLNLPLIQKAQHVELLIFLFKERAVILSQTKWSENKQKQLGKL